MKFGFESEKILYDLQDNSIFHGVFRLVDALTDYVSFHGEDFPKRVSNEFVLNMVEMSMIASTSQREVIEDYLLLYQLVSDVSLREHVALLPLAAVPFHFTPNMVPKWSYYVQNSILSEKRLKEWKLSPLSPLANAGNCAGLHVHFEIETLPEFLMFTKELVFKHNFALMLTPLVAFSASPYFHEEHSAYSMRSHRYYAGVYEKFPLNGGLPPVMNSSEEVLRYTLSGIEHWINAGVQLGFSRSDLLKLTTKKNANWSMIRWNRTWNTVELRCLESDRVDLDIGKFVWASGAMKRLDLKAEALEPETLKSHSKLDSAMIEETFKITGKSVSILPTVAIHELTHRAIMKGLNDPLVERYLNKLSEFIKAGVDEDCLPIFEVLLNTLNKGNTTARSILDQMKHAPRITPEQSVPILRDLISQERSTLHNLRQEFPNVIAKHRSELFPSIPSKKQPPSGTK